jgi:hypothetical protein
MTMSPEIQKFIDDESSDIRYNVSDVLWEATARNLLQSGWSPDAVLKWLRSLDVDYIVNDIPVLDLLKEAGRTLADHITTKTSAPEKSIDEIMQAENRHALFKALKKEGVEKMTVRYSGGAGFEFDVPSHGIKLTHNQGRIVYDTTVVENLYPDDEWSSSDDPD